MLKVRGGGREEEVPLPSLCPTLLKIPDADTPEKSRGGGVLPTKKRELPKNFCAQIAGPCKYTHRFERERERELHLRTLGAWSLPPPPSVGGEVNGTGLEPVTKQATVRYLYHSATAATVEAQSPHIGVVWRFGERDASSATRGLLATVLVILNHGQVTRTAPELAPTSPNYHITPTGGLKSSPQIHLHRPLSQRVFSGTGLEVTSQPRSDTLTTRLPRPLKRGESEKPSQGCD
ncbi:hypothetical protein TNCV_3324781 [Trichonephila clavipes]|nr:hypothetical protein TNCV_3324781 [Trichonephila clavipes]